MAWPSPDLQCSVVADKLSTVVPFSDQVARAAVIVVLIALAIMMVWWLFFITVQLKLHRHCGSIVQTCCHWSSGQKSKFGERVYALYSERRQQRQNEFIKVLAACVPPVLVISWVSSLLQAWQGAFAAVVYSSIFESAGGVLLVISLTCLVISSGNVRLVNADLVLGFFYLLLGLLSMFAESDYYYIWGTRGLQVAQLVIAVMMSRVRSVLLPMLINCLFQIFIIFDAPALRSGAAFHLTGTFLVQCGVFGVTVASENWLMAEVGAMVGKMEAGRSEATAHGLLAMMCDAVVPLCHEMKLREPCPRLAAVLVSGNAQNNVGKQFQKFLTPGDRPRFDDFMENRLQEGPGAAGSIHVGLVDAMGGTVKVQLFHTSLTGWDGQLSHLVGILEEKDSEGFGNATRAHGGPGDVRGDVRSAHEDLKLREVEVDRDSQSGASGTTGRSSKSKVPTVRVSADLPFLIQEVSPAVGKLFRYISSDARILGTSIANWLEAPEPFMEFLQDGVLTVQDSRESMTAQFGPCYVRPVGGHEVQSRLVMLQVTITYRPRQSPETVIQFRPVKVIPKAKLPSSKQDSQGQIFASEEVPEESHSSHLTDVRRHLSK